MFVVNRIFENPIYTKKQKCLTLDVIGVVKSVSDMETIVSKTSLKEFKKRELLLVDENASITVTLWGPQVDLLLVYIIESFLFFLG